MVPRHLVFLIYMYNIWNIIKLNKLKNMIYIYVRVNYIIVLMSSITISICLNTFCFKIYITCTQVLLIKIYVLITEYLIFIVFSSNHRIN